MQLSLSSVLPHALCMSSGALGRGGGYKETLLEAELTGGAGKGGVLGFRSETNA